MKDDLRYKFKIKRKYFQYSRREVADGAICDNFLSAYGGYDSFFIYYSFGSEADTHALIGRLIALGKRVFLPRVVGKEMEAVEYTGEGTPMSVNAFGIAEPQGQAFAGDFDVVVAPLLAVNSGGYRLGYGGGYYDKFMKNTNAVKAGLGYAFQMTDEFEEDGWDIPLDSYVCERGIYTFGQTG